MTTIPATPTERADNERALARLHRLFPRLPKKETAEFLIECTAFPFNSLPGAVEQAAELSRRCGKSVERAYLTAHRDMDREMRSFNRRHPAEDTA